MPGLIAPPVIATARLRLRAHGRDDADALAELWADSATTRFIGGAPASREESWGRLLRYAGHWSLNGYGFWAIEEIATGHYIGDAGLFEGRRGLGDDFDDAPEAGWVLAAGSHGKGYAREAVAAALAWGEGVLGARRTVCMIDPTNAPSIRTAEALGFRKFDERAYKDKTIGLFERERE